MKSAGKCVEIFQGHSTVTAICGGNMVILVGYHSNTVIVCSNGILYIKLDTVRCDLLVKALLDSR